ncbi:12008_t:CDS:1, partial [Funneliformis caledonium]
STVIAEVTYRATLFKVVIQQYYVGQTMYFIMLFLLIEHRIQNFLLDMSSIKYTVESGYKEPVVSEDLVRYK